ncbi:MAG: hypothetical protein ACRDSN_08590 [Pseudonocardiaceae bacterium]
MTNEQNVERDHGVDLVAVLLLVELRRARAALAIMRLRYANLVAAGRATLVAAADGEADPLAYLRDELPPAPPDHPLHGMGPGWWQ